MSLFRREQPLDRETLEQLYIREKRSMQEIAEALGCSAHKVGYWMAKYGIERRGWNEATYLKRNPNGDPFQIKQLDTEQERELFTLVMGLYLGEGTKRNGSVSLSNTDPDIIRAFLRFLREICQVQEQKIYAWLNLFDDVNEEKALAYWQTVTAIPRARFFKSTIRKGKGGSYRTKSEYGTLTVGVKNTKLAEQVNAWTKDSLDRIAK